MKVVYFCKIAMGFYMVYFILRSMENPIFNSLLNISLLYFALLISNQKH